MIAVAALQSDFFLLDDHVEIVGKLRGQYDLSALYGWRELLLAPAAGPTGRPVAVVSFALQSLLSPALSAASFKLVNVGLHGLAGLLLYRWLRALSLSVPLNVEVATVLWLLLPIHVSTLLYPVQRMTVLASVFILLGLWCFTRARTRWAARGADAAEVTATLLWICLFGLLATLSKENGVLLFWLIPLIEWCFYRGQWAGRDSVLLRNATAVLLIVPLIALPAYFAVSGLLESYASRPFTVAERLLTEARVLWLYVQWIALPLPQSLGLLHDDIALSTGLLAPPLTLVAVAGWILAAALAITVRTRSPLLSFSILFFLIAHSLESSLLPLELVFEHRNYLASIGVVLLIGQAVAAVRRRVGAGTDRYIAVYLLLLALVLGAKLWSWSDEGRFYRQEFLRQEGQVRAGYLYADFLQRQALQTPVETREPTVMAARQVLLDIERVHPGSLVPCAGLFLLDSQWLPGNPQQPGWLQCVSDSLATGQVGTVERNALLAVLRRVAGTDAPAALVAQLLDHARELGVADTEIALLRSSRSADADPPAGRPALATDPLPPVLPPVAVQFAQLDRAAAAGRSGEALSIARIIYARDDKRRYISALRRRLGD